MIQFYTTRLSPDASLTCPQVEYMTYSLIFNDEAAKAHLRASGYYLNRNHLISAACAISL